MLKGGVCYGSNDCVSCSVSEQLTGCLTYTARPVKKEGIVVVLQCGRINNSKANECEGQACIASKMLSSQGYVPQGNHRVPFIA
jgi:hypothetical protein